MITSHTKESLQAFERRIVDHFAAGELPCLIHLSGGNEDELLRIFGQIRTQDWVFSSHRSHYHALLKGIPEATVEAEILAGRSMFIFSAEHRFVTSSVLGSTPAIAAGVAEAIHRANQHPENLINPARVWCFLGDGAEEQGGYYEAALFVEAHNIPCTFIVEDNERQVETYIRERRGYGAARFPLSNFNCVRRYTYVPQYPHGGAGLPAGSVSFKQSAIHRIRSAA